jgi:stage II sporulation protein P
MFLWKLILCFMAASAIAGALTVKVLTSFEDKKSTAETIIIIDDNDAPAALAYYDMLYNSDNIKNKDIKITAGTNTNNDIYASDRPSLPEGESALLPVDLSREGLQLINETGYTPDLGTLLKTDINLPEDTDVSYSHTNFTESAIQPLVLILHTHGTEAYADEDAVSYATDYGFRSGDITKNVVSVGSAMAEEFNNCGVPAIHCTVMHDKESYLNSYNRAAETINYYLDKYPSIICVLDIHRDALQNTGGDILRPVTVVKTDDGATETAAQIMSVVGTDDRGAIHPEWRRNLVLAVKLQDALDLNNVNLARPINLRSAAFNQQFAPLSLLIEVGSTGNTLTEAIRSGIIVAKTLAGILLNVV